MNVSCQQCGSELLEGARFCQICGATTAGPSEAPFSPPPASASRASSGVSSSDRNMAMLCHLISFAGIVIPFGNILGPLVIWLTQRERSPFVDEHGKESINFQISVSIYSFVGIILLVVGAILVVVVVGILVLVVVGLLMLTLLVFSFVVVIVAAIRAGNGESYSYPLSIPFLK